MTVYVNAYIQELTVKNRLCKDLVEMGQSIKVKAASDIQNYLELENMFLL